MENENKVFYIEMDNKKLRANILTNFEVYGDNYCIYTINVDGTKMNNVYCAKIVDNNLVEIKDETELKLTNKIIYELFG